ncbi:hypothetical protein L227DRAFT_221466 [Lentinus tigrinus ALCF2SS1-6]|uniref:Uncharacterized protein n=1 Tax=Lentinus tigrinus ALCF2SS1-6 TaxID=1328759 RepID=A0A5C2S8P8_9APHY|nr:hypothetical protein L227DRAFT_221466 [Lentinus tigrinus ALCF2SS1-6]
MSMFVSDCLSVTITVAVIPLCLCLSLGVTLCSRSRSRPRSSFRLFKQPPINKISPHDTCRLYSIASQSQSQVPTHTLTCGDAAFEATIERVLPPPSQLTLAGPLSPAPGAYEIHQAFPHIVFSLSVFLRADSPPALAGASA